MVLADHVAHHPRRFAIGTVVVVALLVHGKQHAPVHRLEAVAHVGNGPAHDDAHGVFHVGIAHLVFDVHRDDVAQLVGIHRAPGCCSMKKLRVGWLQSVTTRSSYAIQLRDRRGNSPCDWKKCRRPKKTMVVRRSGGAAGEKIPLAPGEANQTIPCRFRRPILDGWAG